MHPVVTPLIKQCVLICYIYITKHKKSKINIALSARKLEKDLFVSLDVVLLTPKSIIDNILILFKC